MKNKKTIPIIALAVFSISLLIMVDMITRPQNMAFALVATDFFAEGNANTVYYWQQQHKFVMCENERTNAASNSPNLCQFVTATVDDNGDPVINKDTFNLFPVWGNQLATPNPCDDSDGCNVGASSWTGGIRSMWCALSYCYTLWNGNNNAHQVLKFDNAGIIKGYMNLTLGDAIAPFITGYQILPPSFPSTTLFIWQEAPGISNIEVRVIGDNLILGTAATSNDRADVITSILGMDVCLNCGGTNDEFLVSIETCSAGGDNCIISYSPNTNVMTLSRTSAQLTADFGAITFSASAKNAIRYAGDDNCGFVVAGQGGANNVLGIINAGCNFQGFSGQAGNYTTSASLADNNYIAGLQVDTTNEMIYAYTSSTLSQAKVVQVYMGNFSKVAEYQSVGGSQTLNSIGLDSEGGNPNRMLLATSTTVSRMYFFDPFFEEPPTTSPFCQQPQNVNLLRCRIEAQGGEFSSNNGLNSTNPFNPIGSGNQLVVDVLGLQNNDVKTNGVGYLLLAFALILMVALFFLATKDENGIPHFEKIPLYVYLIVSITIMAAFILMGITDATFLIIAIVALVALSAPKLVSIISSRGGESV